MDEKKLAAADIEAEKIIREMMARAGAVAFIPGAGTIIAAFVDMALVERIAVAYGVENYEYEAVMAKIGAALSGKYASSLFLSFIPVLGWAVNSTIAASVTLAAGYILRDYFREKSPYLN